jgi:SSS family solute:Na+ symporter
MGSIFFGIALSLQALVGYNMTGIMTVIGICIIVYTVLGGMEAVIWTEVIQAVIKTLGAFLIVYLIIKEMPGGTSAIIAIAERDHKFSLGSISPNFTEAGFWVILFYGFFINLNNFGMDQNYVQRYHTAASTEQAARSIWLCVGMYVPASFLFFVIGTCLYAFYNVQPELLEIVRERAAIEKFGSMAGDQLSSAAASLKPADYGDKVLPYFMVTRMPSGVVGLIVSAILSAAMSTISSGMNASATVFTIDIYKRYFQPGMNDKKQLFILQFFTFVFGVLGLLMGIMMIGSKSVLDTWWELSGIFAGGMLGLFLLGIVSRRTKSHEALIATLLGVVIILWMTLSHLLPVKYEFLRNPLNKNMVIVVGTLTIFLTGILITRPARAEGLTEISNPSKK